MMGRSKTNFSGPYGLDYVTRKRITQKKSEPSQKKGLGAYSVVVVGQACSREPVAAACSLSNFLGILTPFFSSILTTHS